MFTVSQRALQSADVDTGSTVHMGKCSIHYVLTQQHPALGHSDGFGEGAEH